MITLRPDQEPAVEAIEYVDRGIVQAPAGAGKTVIGAMAALRRQQNYGFPLKILIVANTIEQCEQWKDACWNVGLAAASLDIKCYQAGSSCIGLDLVLFDECHHIASPEFRKCLDGYDGPRWGFSATPDRADEFKDDVYELIGPIVYEVPRAELVETGKLAPAKVYFLTPNEPDEWETQIEVEADIRAAKMEYAVPHTAFLLQRKSIEGVTRLLGKETRDKAIIMAESYDLDVEGSMKSLLNATNRVPVAQNNGQHAQNAESVRRWLKEAAQKELLSRACWQACQQIGIIDNAARNGAIADHANAARNDGDSVLVLVGSIEHGKALCEWIPGSIVLHSKMGAAKRREGMAMFRDGRLKVAIATSLADEGLDVPRANVLILAAAGRSAAKAEQRTGRVLRAWGEKTHGTIYDFWDVQHGLLLNQARARAKVYAGLNYEFVGAERVLPTVLKAIGITCHPALGMGPKKKLSVVGAKKKGPSALVCQSGDREPSESNSEAVFDSSHLHEPWPNTPVGIIVQERGCINPAPEPYSEALNPPVPTAPEAVASCPPSKVDAIQEPIGSDTCTTSLETKAPQTGGARSSGLVSGESQIGTSQEQELVSAKQNGDSQEVRVQSGSNSSGGVGIQGDASVCLRREGPGLFGLSPQERQDQKRPDLSPVSGSKSEGGLAGDSQVCGDVRELPSKTPLLAETVEGRKHARLSPSTLKGKAICSGFRNDPSGDKTASNRGTLGHKCVEEEKPELAGDDEQLKAAAVRCIAYKKVLRHRLFAHPDGKGKFRSERQEVRLPYFDQWGFCDLLLMAGSFAILADWKFAFNFHPASGPQFQAYLIGVWDKYPLIETIEVHTVHPFLNQVDIETYTRAGHYSTHSTDLLSIIAKSNLDRPEDYRITDQCRYCGFAGKCWKLADAGLTIGRSYAPDIEIPETTTFHGSEVTDPRTLADLHTLAPIMIQAAGGWKKAALDMNDSGTPIPGYEIATKAGKRSVTSAKIAYQIIKKNFAPQMQPEDFLAHCDVTVGGLEELVGAASPKGMKGKNQALLEAHLEDEDCMTFGGGSRYLRKIKQEEPEE